MLISLEALETGTYQYYDDNWGTRLYRNNKEKWNHLYDKRPSILELTKSLQSTPVESHRWGLKWKHFAHEIMLKERVAPELFQGIVVDRIETRNALLKHLRSCHLVQKDQVGQETILGKSVNEFIQLQKPLHLS